MTQRAVHFEGVHIGSVTPRWVQTDPFIWVEQWDLADEPLCFDSYEDACAYLCERYAKAMTE